MFYVLTDNSKYGLKQIQAAMVSIHSDEENRFVSRMSGHHIWLAASNINRFVCKKPKVPGWSLHRRLQGNKGLKPHTIINNKTLREFEWSYQTKSCTKISEDIWAFLQDQFWPDPYLLPPWTRWPLQHIVLQCSRADSSPPDQCQQCRSTGFWGW